MENENTDNSGYIYILTSPKTECIKIGGTDYPPLKRIREINSTEPYKSIGPWTLSDFRQVTDWRKVEYSLHYMFRSKLNVLINNQKELFHLSPHEASDKLNEIETTMIISKPKVDRMFQDTEFSEYLVKLFRFTGLMNWLDIQGAWTFVLFPSTNGGRYFTINIGPHEVAFSTLSRKGEKSVHMILMDRLILDYDDVKKWILNKNGEINEESYAKALPRSTSIIFEGSFSEVIDFLNMDGVRRALIAYWNEALIRLKENNKLSVFSRYHNWNAIAELHKKIIENG
jgi:hypothetical protein